MDSTISVLNAGLTVVAPVLITLKVLNSHDRGLLKSWIKLLVILLVFTNIEKSIKSELLFRILLSVIPFRNSLVLLLNLWLVNPFSQGYVIIFNQFIIPFLSSAKPSQLQSHGKHSLEISERLNVVIFENTFEQVLKIAHAKLKIMLQFVFGFGQKHLSTYQKVVSSVCVPPVYGICSSIYQKLLSVELSAKHFEKRRKRKLKAEKLKNIKPVRPNNAMNDFFSDLNTYDSPPVEPATEIVDHSNYCIEYLVHQYKEKTSISLSFNSFLFLVAYIVGFLTNIILLLFYTMTRKRCDDQSLDKTKKRVSFVESVRAFSVSLRKGSDLSAANLDSRPLLGDMPAIKSLVTLPTIQLIPATPDMNQLVAGKINRPTSKSVGAKLETPNLGCDQPTTSNGQITRPRTNSFKDFFKNPKTFTRSRSHSRSQSRHRETGSDFEDVGGPKDKAGSNVSINHYKRNSGSNNSLSGRLKQKPEVADAHQADMRDKNVLYSDVFANSLNVSEPLGMPTPLMEYNEHLSDFEDTTVGNISRTSLGAGLDDDGIFPQKMDDREAPFLSTRSQDMPEYKKQVLPLFKSSRDDRRSIRLFHKKEPAETGSESPEDRSDYGSLSKDSHNETKEITAWQGVNRDAYSRLVGEEGLVPDIKSHGDPPVGSQATQSIRPKAPLSKKIRPTSQLDQQSIDYLTYQHPVLDEDLKSPYSKSPLFYKKYSDSAESSGLSNKELKPKEKKHLIKKSNSIKLKLKRLSGGTNKI